MASVLDDVLNKATGSVFQSGKLIDDAVVLQVQGKTYHGWDSVSISLSMASMTSTFTVNTADRWRQTEERFPVMPGNAINVSIGGEKMITGYVDQFNASVSNEDRSIVFSGRNKTGDLIDSAAIGTSASYKNLTLQQVATVYAQDFDVKVLDESQKAGEIFPKIVVNQGESIFEFLLRLAKEKGVLLSSNADGDLVITDRLQSTSAVSAGGLPRLGQAIRADIGKTSGLFQGKNVLHASSSFDETDRFQKYLVKSQIQGTDFVKAKDAATINAVAFDSGVLRQRTKYIIAEKSMDKKAALDRATWEANTSAARAATATVVVQGWKDQDGKLWQLNTLVDTDLTFVGFAKGQYLITDLVFSQDKTKGTVTQITLGRADAYSQQEPEVENDPKKDAGWDTAMFGTELSQVAKNLGF